MTITTTRPNAPATHITFDTVMAWLHGKNNFQYVGSSNTPYACPLWQMAYEQGADSEWQVHAVNPDEIVYHHRTDDYRTLNIPTTAEARAIIDTVDRMAERMHAGMAYEAKRVRAYHLRRMLTKLRDRRSLAAQGAHTPAHA